MVEWPSAATKEFAKKGKKHNLSTTANFIDMMIGTSPLGDGRKWAMSVVKRDGAAGARIVAARLALSPKSVMEWYKTFNRGV